MPCLWVARQDPERRDGEQRCVVDMPAAARTCPMTPPSSATNSIGRTQAAPRTFFVRSTRLSLVQRTKNPPSSWHTGTMHMRVSLFLQRLLRVGVVVLA